MTAVGRTTGTTMENGTKEVETGTKRQREVPWIIFGEGEQEPLAMLDGGINMTKRRVAIGVDVDMAMIMAMEEEEAEVVDMVEGVGVASVTVGMKVTMEDMEETTRDLVKTTVALAETTEDIVEMTEDLVEVAMMEDTEEVTRGVMEEIMGVMEILEKVVEVMDILEVTLAMVVAMVHMVDKELREEACWVALEVEVWAVQGVVAGRPTRESDHGVRKPTR